MKKKISRLIIMFICFSSNTYSVNYKINFSGSGISSIVDSVIVQNLRTGNKVRVLDGNSLNLDNNITQLNQLTNKLSFINIYPILTGKGFGVTINTTQSGNVKLDVLGIDGRKITGLNTYIQQGVHKFQFFIPTGVYIIYVTAIGYNYSEKVINTNSENTKSEIVYCGSEKLIESNLQKIKSSSTQFKTFDYSMGDRLLFKGYSGGNCTIITDIPDGDKTINFDFVDCQDACGQKYAVVKIGSQIWMAENLKTTKYQNGNDIPIITNNSSWFIQSGACCDYNNDISNTQKYGMLYNWFAVDDSRKVTPFGWHVPSLAEWTTLISFLGGVEDWQGDVKLTGGKLKDVGTNDWLTPNAGATNETGFSALPGGYRDYYYGTFSYIGRVSYWWSTTQNQYNSNAVWCRAVGSGNDNVYKNYNYKEFGFSIRCIKD